MELRAGLSLRRPLARAALLARLEGLGLLGLGLLYAVRAVLDAPQSRAGTLLGAVLIAGAGVLLVRLGQWVAATRAWARTPLVVVQLLGLLTAFSLAQADAWTPAAVVGLLSGGTLQALVSTEARAAFRTAPRGA